MFSELTTHDLPSRPALFQSMYHDRKAIFVDRLKWNLQHDGQQERDQFDNEIARYLVLHDPKTEQHLASVRLLPTTRPHLMSELFPHLCEDGVPTGPQIWEITRLIISPGVMRRDRLTYRNMLVRALIEYAVLTGIQKYTCVCEIDFLSQLLAGGWRCTPLGLPQSVGGSLAGALLIHIEPDTLSRTRASWRFDSPVFRFDATGALAA